MTPADPTAPTPPAPPGPPAPPTVDAPARRGSLRGLLVFGVVVVVLLVLFAGGSVRQAGEEMQPGWERTMVRIAGAPAGWVSDQLPFRDATDELVATVRPGEALRKQDGFAAQDAAATGDAGAAAAGRVTADAFDPVALGGRAPTLAPLAKVLVTGDSMAQPLDAQLARRLADAKGVQTIRDAHVGTGISQTEIVDWGALSATQEEDEEPGAVVMFMGANEGFPMRGIDCCTPAWAAEYATRARRMMDTYRASGKARVYWLLLPAPREAARQKISRAVNAAIRAAAAPYGAQVRVLDMDAVFTPGGRFRAAMRVGAEQRIVREPDGIHLNEAGAGVAADLVLRALARDFPQVR